MRLDLKLLRVGVKHLVVFLVISDLSVSEIPERFHASSTGGPSAEELSEFIFFVVWTSNNVGL